MQGSIVLDTNVLSEMMRDAPHPAVAAWYLKQRSDSLFTTSVTFAEVLYGVHLLPVGRRRNQLAQFAHEFFQQEFARHILPFDETAATYYAQLRASKRKRGMSMSPFDAQIAAIALAAGASIATRNVADFEHCGVGLVNPWFE